MKVVCISNTISSLAGDVAPARVRESIHADDEIRDLVVGKNFSVVAIEERINGLWFFLKAVPENSYPTPYPAEFFEILDPRLPAGWQIGFSKREGSAYIKRIGFPEWVVDDHYYEKLVNEDDDAMRIFAIRSLDLD